MTPTAGNGPGPSGRSPSTVVGSPCDFAVAASTAKSVRLGAALASCWFIPDVGGGKPAAC